MTLEERLRALAQIEPGDLPFLTIYLDVRPEATGENPQLRSGLVVLKDRLNEIRKTFLPRGDDLDSFEDDARRVTAFVEDEMQPNTAGLALYACSGRSVFEALETQIHFENQVSVGPGPDLFQLARFIDEYETSIVALVDSNTARFFVWRHGALAEVSGPDDDPAHYQKRRMGGWSQARYQRHIEKHRKDFARETAQAMLELDNEISSRHVLLAGDEIAITALRKQLPRQLADKVRSVIRLHIRAPHGEVMAEVEPLFRELEQELAQSAVEELIGELRRGGLGVAGFEATSTALERGQADVVLVDARSDMSDADRSRLVSRAATTGATVEVLDGDDRLLALGGVGALLRFR